MSESRPLPKFESEAEEARWYADHREELQDYFGEPLPPNPMPLAERLGLTANKRKAATQHVPLRIALEDLDRAKALAARKGMPYQTFLKVLIHEGLAREEAR